MIAFAYKMEKQTQWNNSKSIIPLLMALFLYYMLYVFYILPQQLDNSMIPDRCSSSFDNY